MAIFFPVGAITFFLWIKKTFLFQHCQRYIYKMDYLHQDKTLPRARTFAEFLNQFEFQALVDIDATRDYLAKLDVSAAGLHIGKISIYYSPRKKAYTINCQSIGIPAYREILEERWREFQNSLVPETDPDAVSAYVDGSFLHGRIGYGAVLLRNKRILHEICGTLNNQYHAHRQIAGELKAVLEAVAWCRKHKIRELHIYYDYQGIEKWAHGKWKAKTELTQKYQAFMIRQPLDLHFHKIAAHSGDLWNEYADRLAKQACEKGKTEDL